MWRPTWLPLTEEGEDRATASKYGGLPWLSRGESWPSCGHCRRAMHLLIQINLRELPADVGGLPPKNWSSRNGSLRVE